MAEPGPSKPPSKRLKLPVMRHNMVPTALAFDADDRYLVDVDTSDSEAGPSGSEFTDEEAEVEREEEQPGEDAEEGDSQDGFVAIDPHLGDAIVPEYDGPLPGSGRKGKERALFPHDGQYEPEDFNRFVSALGVDIDPGHQQGQAWELSIEAGLAELDLELDGNKAARKKKKPTISRDLPEISPEVQQLLGEANLHYVAHEYDKARDLLNQVIRLEQDTLQPWQTLAAIEEELGNREKALKYRLVGAHLQPRDVEQWKELAARSREEGNLKQAIYCYLKASKADREDIDALWDLSILQKEQGNRQGAIATLKQALRILPHDPFVVRALVEDYIQLQDPQSAVSLANACLSHQRFDNPHGPSADPTGGYIIEDLITLAELLRGMSRYQDAIRTVKTGQRWIQGREDEIFWDTFADDREYDVVREDGRKPPADQPESHNETHLLDWRLRLVLGQSRLAGNTKDRKEAQRHFNTLTEEYKVEDNYQLYGDIADENFERRQWAEAFDVLNKMIASDIPSTVVMYAKMAQCLKRLKDFDGAILLYKEVIETDSEDLDSKLQLAELYEMQGQREQALELINKVVVARAERGMVEEREGFANVQRRAIASRQRALGEHTSVSRAQRQEMEAQLEQDVQRAYELLKEYEPKMQAGDEAARKEWFDISQFLVDIFRESKAMFPADLGRYRHAKAAPANREQTAQPSGVDIDAYADNLASRIQRSMVQEVEEEPADNDKETDPHMFRSIHLNDWLQIAVKYAFERTKDGGHEEAHEVLSHLQTSVLRTMPANVRLLRIAISAVALYHCDYTTAVDEVRKFLLLHPYQNEPLRLMQAVVPASLAAAEVASLSNHQKFIMRQLKLIQTAADGAGGKKGGAAMEEDDDAAAADADAAAEKGESAKTSFRPSRASAAFFAHYGNIMGGSKSYQAAIIYYLRAYELAPNDPLICLCLGVQYLQRAMQRQSDNRHHQISQGLAFFGRYRTLRGPCQEVEYNIGRAFHGVGLVDGAIKSYERVLEMEEARQAEAVMQVDGVNSKSFARDAAYNLVLLFSTMGARDVAKEVSRKWMRF